MTDQDDRRKEAFATEETRYERLGREEERARDDAAARLASDPLPEPEED